MLGLVVVVAAGAAALVVAPPIDFIKTQAIAEIKSRTGRDLTISGPVEFSVFPALMVKLTGVTLSGPPGMGAAPFAVAKGVEARVKLLSLLQRRLSVDRLILSEPVFDFRIDASGRRSWDFSPPAKTSASVMAPARVEVAQAKSALPDAVRDFVDNASNPDNPSPSASAKLAVLDDLTLDELKIEQGTVHYADARSGVVEAATAIDAQLTLTALQNPLETTGTLTWNGQPVGFDVRLASPRALIEDRPARLRLAIKAAPVDARFDGSMTTRAGVELDGDLAAKGSSLRALAKWLGTELPPADGFGAHMVEAKLKASTRGVVLSDARAALDGATASGTLAVDVTGARPKLTGNVKLSYLDLNRYTLAAATTGDVRPVIAKPKAMAPSAGSSVGKSAPASIEDLINAAPGLSGLGVGVSGANVPGAGVPGAQVKGYTARDGWSGDPIRLDGLGAADADLRLGIGGLRWRDIKTGAAVATVSLKSKVLKVNLDDIMFYDGKGRAVVTLDANPQVPVFGLNLSADSVSGLPLLTDAIGFDRLSGKAKLQLAVGARGKSELEIVENLSGKADFAFTNGAVQGFNVGGALKALEQRRIPNFKASPTEATEFSELTASFVIDRGIATNNDLKLFSPLIRVGGSGNVALPARTIDYVLRPRLVASGQGQGATDKTSGDKLAGLEIPLKVRGPLGDPAIEPDFNAILKDPNKALEAGKELLKPFKGAGSGLMRSLLGRGDSQGQSGVPGGATDGQAGGNQKIDTKKLLDGVLGR